jgi:hypothetical protein
MGELLQVAATGPGALFAPGVPSRTPLVALSYSI